MTDNSELPQICYICWNKKQIEVEKYLDHSQTRKVTYMATCIRCKGEGVIYDHPTYNEFLEICDESYKPQNPPEMSSLQSKVLHMSGQKGRWKATIEDILAKYK